MKLTIVIPAYNEEMRIGPTLRAYHAFFSAPELGYTTHLLVVINGCKDNTARVVDGLRQELGSMIRMIEIAAGGKGLAVTTGFLYASAHGADVIGFVDADMATKPEAFFALLASLDAYDGAIASRYMKGSHVFPARPFYKRWGSKLIYESLVWLLFGLRYRDLQCGAKVFKKKVVQVVAKELRVKQWAFDVELLYLCKKNGFKILEIPTTWHDQAGSKLTLKSGIRMLGALFKLRFYHSIFAPFWRN